MLDTMYAFHTKPYAHQLTVFERAKDAPSFAFLMDMGTGKTKVTLDNAAYLYEQGKISAVVILAPKGVHAQWINEQVPTHVPPRVKAKTWLYMAGRKMPEWVLSRRPDGLTIIAINIESMSYGNGPTMLNQLVKSLGDRMMLVIDEASRIKNPQARRTKALLKVAPRVAYKRILTGTPITQGLQDLFAPFQYLEPGSLGVSTYMGFRNRYCEVEQPRGRGLSPHAYKIIGYKNTDDLLSRIAPISYQVKKEDCLDLPPKVYVTRYVELSPEQRTHYIALKKEALTILDSGAVISPINALELLLRLQQVVCGYLPAKDSYTELPCPRIDDAVDCIEEAGAKTLLWCRFKADVRRLSDELTKRGISHVIHTGDVPSAQREVAKIKFMSDPTIRVFLATTGSGGIGLNLTAATTVIYYSNDFSAEMRWQSEDRAHRIGQTSRVTYIDLVAPGTIDKRILDALRGKRDVSSMALTQLRALIASVE